MAPADFEIQMKADFTTLIREVEQVSMLLQRLCETLDEATNLLTIIERQIPAD